MRCCAGSWKRSRRGNDTLVDASEPIAHSSPMNLTAVFKPAPEGGFTAFVKEIPGAISEGETMAETRENLADAFRMVLECNRDIAREYAVR